MTRRFRPGTVRQASITYCAVLPVSLVLNEIVDPLIASWPRLAVLVFNATVLVAALNWLLLPALHAVTRGWATAPTGFEPPRQQEPGSATAEARPGDRVATS